MLKTAVLLLCVFVTPSLLLAVPTLKLTFGGTTTLIDGGASDQSSIIGRVENNAISLAGGQITGTIFGLVSGYNQGTGLLTTSGANNPDILFEGFLRNTATNGPTADIDISFSDSGFIFGTNGFGTLTAELLEPITGKPQLLPNDGTLDPGTDFHIGAVNVNKTSDVDSGPVTVPLSPYTITLSTTLHLSKGEAAGFRIRYNSTSLSAVPEPQFYGVLAAGLTGLLVAARRRSK